jgi:hypothetical protein
VPPRGWTPDTRQRLQRATRFFARLESFDLECPHCGKVYQVRVRGLRRRSQRQSWDPATGRFRCTAKGGCQRRYVLGIVAWPIGTGPSAATATPEDSVPWPRQLAQIRREGGGWWLADEASITVRRPVETNLTTEQDRPRGEDDDE